MAAVTVKIYQLKDSADDLLFEPYEPERYNFDNYKQVYLDWKPEGYTVEDAFYEFNMNRPKDFKGHSLSVSDLVEIDGERFYCDDIGWARV